MLVPEIKKLGQLQTTSYTFENVGDVLPMHNHPELAAHITIVARGSFVMRGAGWKKNVDCGALIDFPYDTWHEFESIEANSKLVNVTKHIGDDDVRIDNS